MGKQILIIGFFICSLGHNAFGQLDIYLKEYKMHFTPKKCQDSVIMHNSDSSFVIIELFNCMGKMKISKFDRKGSLMESGQYVASLDTLKQYIEHFDLMGDLIEIRVDKFFQPLRDGIWEFYKEGIFQRTQKFRKGIPIRE